MQILMQAVLSPSLMVVAGTSLTAGRSDAVQDGVIIVIVSGPATSLGQPGA
jgi:hypothetical protein